MKNIITIICILATASCSPSYSGKVWEPIDTTIAKIKGLNKSNFPVVDNTSLYATNNTVHQSVWKPAPEQMTLPAGTNTITIKHEYKPKIDAPTQTALVPLNISLEGGKNYVLVAQNGGANALAWVEDDQGRKVSNIGQAPYKTTQPQASLNNVMLSTPAPLVAPVIINQNAQPAVIQSVAPIEQKQIATQPINTNGVAQNANIVQTGVVNNIPVFTVVNPR
jgi:hypothetical protein